MPGPIVIVVFAAVLLVGLALVYALSGGSMVVTKRLGRLWGTTSQRRDLKETRRQVVNSLFSGVGKLLPSEERTPELDLRLLQAGFRRPEVASLLRLARFVVITGLVCLIYFTGFYKNNPLLLFPVAVATGYILPDMWISRRIRNRQHRLRLALPDALDLLVICMEAGLGIDQAMLYVSQELRLAHPELCGEFDVVNAEMHVGKTRLEALRSLATRTGVDDLQALVATLIQTDRFGTSVAQSLRVHADELRIKRRQRAEEMAAKTTVKLVFPLVFFIFPALFVVILAPAIIAISRTLAHLH